jgi:hypothetical protein
MSADPVTKFSEWMDRNVFMVRSAISTAMAITAFTIIRQSKHGKRISTKTLQQFNHQKLFGKFLVQDSKLYFYHEPFFLRFVLGRRSTPEITDCVLVQLPERVKVLDLCKNQMGMLQLQKIEQDHVIGTPLIRLKWYHLRRTDMIHYYSTLHRKTVMQRITSFFK